MSIREARRHPFMRLHELHFLRKPMPSLGPWV